jgi:hypothetical protein
MKLLSVRQGRSSYGPCRRGPATLAMGGPACNYLHDFLLLRLDRDRIVVPGQKNWLLSRKNARPGSSTPTYYFPPHLGSRTQTSPYEPDFSPEDTFDRMPMIKSRRRQTWS